MPQQISACPHGWSGVPDLSIYYTKGSLKKIPSAEVSPDDGILSVISFFLSQGDALFLPDQAPPAGISTFRPGALPELPAPVP
jgi:hypothetical protein